MSRTSTNKQLKQDVPFGRTSQLGFGNRRRLFLSIISLVFSMLSYALDIPCESLTPINDAIEKSDLIFVGEPKNNGNPAKVEIFRRYKGNAIGSIFIDSWEPLYSEEYRYFVFFLRHTKIDNMYYKTLCTAIKPVEFSGNELFKLGEPEWSSVNE